MEVSQVYEIVNEAAAQTLGRENPVQEDMSNLVDIGNEIFNSEAVDKWVRTLINRIGKVQFVNRGYRSTAPSIMMDDWEFGSVLEKIRSEMPRAEENESWNLTPGASYDPNVFYGSVARAKFFNKMTTFEVPKSLAPMQIKQSFTSASQLNAFTSMLLNEVDKTMTVAFDDLIMRTINNMIGETFYDAFNGGAITGPGNAKCINLLSRFNTLYSKSLTASTAISDPDFLRYAAMQMDLTVSRLTRLSTLFNIGGRERFTPKDLQHFVMLADFKASADIYLQSATFHDEYTKLKEAETVPFWQGSGTDYAFSNVSKIYLETADGHAVEASGILGVLFDHDAVGVHGYNNRTTSNYNGKAEFTNYWYKRDARYFNDMDENFVVFYVA